MKSQQPIHPQPQARPVESQRVVSRAGAALEVREIKVSEQAKEAISRGLALGSATQKHQKASE